MLSLFSKLRTIDKENFLKIKKGIYVYGAGNLGIYISENINLFLNGYKVDYFIDDDLYKRGRAINNIPIISFSEFKKIHNGSSTSELILAIKNLNSIKKKKS